MTKKGYVALNVMVTPDQKTELEESARELDVSISAFVRQVLTYNKYNVIKILRTGRKQA